MNEDIQRYQQRRYVAQVIEILLFNDLIAGTARAGGRERGRVDLEILDRQMEPDF